MPLQPPTMIVIGEVAELGTQILFKEQPDCLWRAGF